jgi:hypothetical protein
VAVRETALRLVRNDAVHGAEGLVKVPDGTPDDVDNEYSSSHYIYTPEVWMYREQWYHRRRHEERENDVSDLCCLPYLQAGPDGTGCNSPLKIAGFPPQACAQGCRKRYLLRTC